MLLKLHSNRTRDNTQLRMEEDLSGKKKDLGFVCCLDFIFLNHEGAYVLEQVTPARCTISILRDAQNPVDKSFLNLPRLHLLFKKVRCQVKFELIKVFCLRILNHLIQQLSFVSTHAIIPFHHHLLWTTGFPDNLYHLQYENA